MIKKILRTCRRQEHGSVIVIFALSLVTLLTFVSLAIDIGMVRMKQTAMMDLCQQMRKARLDAKDYIMNADNPALMIYEISNQCAIANGFIGDLKVYYREDTDPLLSAPGWVDRRTYDVRIELQQEYRCAFAAAFITGSGTLQITVYLDGGEQKTSGKDKWEKTVPVWYPGKEKTRTGAYQRTDLAGKSVAPFTPGDCPAEWKMH